MSRRQKQFEQLDALEREFKASLMSALRGCADGHDSLLFTVPELMPDYWPRRIRSETTDDLLRVANQIIDDRTRYGVGLEGCVAARFRAACHSYMDFDDHNRLGPHRLARSLLAEFQNP